VEEKRPDEMEMAAKTYAKRKSKTCAKEISLRITKALNRSSNKIEDEVLVLHDDEYLIE